MKIEKINERLIDCRRMANMGIDEKSLIPSNKEEFPLVVQKVLETWQTTSKTLRHWMRMYSWASDPKRSHVMHALETGGIKPSDLIDFLHLRGEKSRSDAIQRMGAEQVEFVNGLRIETPKKENGQQDLFDHQEAGSIPYERLFGKRILEALINHVSNIKAPAISEGSGSLTIQLDWDDRRDPGAVIGIKGYLTSKQAAQVGLGELK